MTAVRCSQNNPNHTSLSQEHVYDQLHTYPPNPILCMEQIVSAA